MHKQSRFPELDGLRGIAALMVIAYHFSPALNVAASPLHQMGFLCGFGVTGVDLFFVLSGFLITGILLREKGMRQYFRRFYTRRLLRIFPVYFLGLIIILALGCLRLIPPGQIDSWVLLGYGLNLSNWLSLFHAELLPLSHFWSLSVEEQFYLFWPLAIACLGRKGQLRLIGFLILLAPLSRYLLLHEGWGERVAYVLTPSRLDGLAIGALVAIAVRSPGINAWFQRHMRIPIVCALVLIPGWYWAGSSLMPTRMLADGLKSPWLASCQYTLFALAYASLVWGAVLNTGQEGWPLRLLRCWPLQQAGRYSYAAYVFHLPLFYLLFPLDAPLSQQARTLASLPLFLGGIFLSFLLAALSWHTMEKRILAWKDVLVPAPEATEALQKVF